MRCFVKTNIRYSIINVFFWICGFSISLIGVLVLLFDVDGVDYTSFDLWLLIGWGTLFLISIIMLLNSIKNIQWFDIADGYITVYNPFGIVKCMQFFQIKKAFKTNAVIWGLRMLANRREHIVLCLYGSVTKGLVYDAYNRKKNPYVIIPYTEEVKDLICTEYKKICGEELVIK